MRQSLDVLYMREFAEGNARGADLWRCLQVASQQPVTQIMESWILQGGHPCVNVNLEDVNGQPQLRLSQKRFFSNPQMKKENAQAWQAPLVIRHADDAGMHITRHFLVSSAETLTLPLHGTLRWCYANADKIGFYRQNLDAALLSKILACLEQLNPSEQMGLLSDQWALTRSGDQNIAQFLDVLTALASKSDNYNLLFEIVERLRRIEQMVEDTGSSTAGENRVQRILYRSINLNFIYLTRIFKCLAAKKICLDLADSFSPMFKILNIKGFYTCRL